jgi:outer membrane murein-binding lipoprotein Lpp
MRAYQCQSCGGPLYSDECADPNCRASDLEIKNTGLEARVETLEARIAALESENAALQEAVRMASKMIRHAGCEANGHFNCTCAVDHDHEWRARPAVSEALRGGEHESK